MKQKELVVVSLFKKDLVSKNIDGLLRRRILS